MKILFLLIFVFSLPVFAKLSVATTTTDLAAIVKEVGKDQVSVFAIAKGSQDPHQIEAKPSFMVKLKDVDLVIAQGLELETAWIDPLIQGARNPKIKSKLGYMELAGDLNPIEIAKSNVSRAEGDVHPGGNPHFQLDPIRVGEAAMLIAKRLSELDTGQKAFYEKNAEDFNEKMKEKTKEWQARIKKVGVKEIVTYHKTFSYFCERFQLKCDLQLEPKPGIPPTAGHILSVIDEMKSRKLKLVMIENLYDESAGNKILQDYPTAIIKRVSVSVDGEPGINTNIELIESLVRTLEVAGVN